MIDTPRAKPLWVQLAAFTCMILPDAYVYYYFDYITNWRVFGLIGALSVIIGLALAVYSLYLFESNKEDYNNWKLGTITIAMDIVYTVCGITCFLALLMGFLFPLMTLILFLVGWVLTAALLVSIYIHKSEIRRKYEESKKQVAYQRPFETEEQRHARRVRSITYLLREKRRDRGQK